MNRFVGLGPDRTGSRAWKSGATLVIVNREPTNLDDLADLVINAEIGPTLDVAVNGYN